MLSFATEFAVDANRTSAEFLTAVREWLLGSPHTSFEAADLVGFDTTEEWSARKADEFVEMLQFSLPNNSSSAVRYTKTNGGLEWVSTIVFARGTPSSWIGVRTSVESPHPSARVPAAKKPVFVRTFLNRLGGGKDGDLYVQNAAFRLVNSDIDTAARAIAGLAGCRMPIVYVSAQFHGGYVINVDSLAEQLAGMAHLLVEPNRVFSTRLMQEVSAQNVYGGTIGVYWPDGGGRRSFFLGNEFESPAELEYAVVDEVRTALTNRRPMARVTWSAVREQISRKVFAALREQGSTQIEQYISEFDKEVSAKNTEVTIPRQSRGLSNCEPLKAAKRGR